MKKKIIFIIIIVLCFYKNVYAETFYGEYRLVNEYDKYKEDEVLIEKYKIYNTYKKEYIDLGYMKDNNIYIKDENDYIEETIYDLENDEYIEIVTPTKDTFEFTLYNLPLFTKINELEIYIDNKKYNYFIYNRHMLGNTINNMNDNDYDTIFNHVNDKYITLLFYRTDIENIKIIIYTEECKDANFELTLTYNKIPITLTNNKKNKHIITFKYDETIDYEQINYINKKTIKLYKYYKENIIKLNNYVRNGDNIIIDDYKDIYNIYVRDKLVLKDKLVINKKNTKVLDLIEYSTDDVLVDCNNIDYNKNDKYTCNFILNDIKISKEITIDIKENMEINNIIFSELKENVEETQELSEIKEEITKDIIKNVSSYPKNKIIKMKKLKKNNLKNNNNTTTKNTSTTTKPIIKISQDNVKEKDNKYMFKIVKYLIILNFIIIKIILYLKKRNRNYVERV